MEQSSSATTQTLRLTRPDDWHLHVRDGAALRCVLPHSAAQFGRAIIMPNLRPARDDDEGRTGLSGANSLRAACGRAV